MKMLLLPALIMVLACTQPLAPSPTAIPVRYEVASWAGSATKNTETFHIPSDQWIIEWAITSGPLRGRVGENFFVWSVEAVTGKETSVINASDIKKDLADSTIVRGNGDYHLEITSVPESYVIKVFAFR